VAVCVMCARHLATRWLATHNYHVKCAEVGYSGYSQCVRTTVQVRVRMTPRAAAVRHRNLTVDTSTTLEEQTRELVSKSA